MNPQEPLSLRIRRLKLDQFLQDQRCTLWPGSAWDVTDEKERAQAVAFLEQILDSVS